MKIKIIALAAAAAAVFAVQPAYADKAADYEKFTPEILKEQELKSDITRGEFCHVIYKLLELRGKAPMQSVPAFTDTDDGIIGALCGCGIIEGYSDTEFAPDAFLTREQAGKIACAAMDYMGMEDKNIVKGSFKDSAEISYWARDYVNRLGRNYIMNGYGVDLYYDIPGATKVRYYSYEPFTLDRSNFAPTDNFTREQSLIIAKRIYASEPVYSDNTYSWDMGDNVTLYENADTLWAEVNGSVTF